jgi:hypothetical protein
MVLVSVLCGDGYGSVNIPTTYGQQIIKNAKNMVHWYSTKKNEGEPWDLGRLHSSFNAGATWHILALAQKD